MPISITPLNISVESAERSSAQVERRLRDGVQDNDTPENAASRASRSLSLSANAGMTMRASRSKKTVRDVLERLKWQRRQAQHRRELWLQYADPVAAGDKADAIADIQQKLETAKQQLSQLPQIAWCDHATRVRLPALCGSRPYFPAAP